MAKTGTFQIFAHFGSNEQGYEGGGHALPRVYASSNAAYRAIEDHQRGRPSELPADAEKFEVFEYDDDPNAGMMGTLLRVVRHDRVTRAETPPTE